jgi:Sulfotransferase family
MFNSPSFLIIGPAKTGTTWLYEQLKHVRGIEMPPIKEISFFKEVHFKEMISANKGNYPETPEPGGVELSETNIKGTSQRFKKRHKAHMHTAFKQGRFFWGLLCRYFPRNKGLLSWYLYSKLFIGKSGGLSGDISPPYFTLSESIIALIRKRFPNLKVVIIIREPAERAWSNIRMNYQTEKDLGAMTMEDYVKTDTCRKRYMAQGNYQQTITRWEKHILPNHIQYLFYDDLATDARKFLQQFLDFLQPGLRITQLIESKIGEGKEHKMPESVHEELVKNNLDQYQFLAQKFGPGTYPARWLKDALKLVETGK